MTGNGSAFGRFLINTDALRRAFMKIMDVEAVEYFLLPLPQKFNRFRFHIPAPCFIKNTSASGSSKSQMLPSLLPLPASFFKVLPLPQKFNRFRFHIPSENYIAENVKLTKRFILKKIAIRLPKKILLTC